MDNEWLRGKPLSIKTYKKNPEGYQLIRKVDNLYLYGGNNSIYDIITPPSFMTPQSNSETSYNYLKNNLQFHIPLIIFKLRESAPAQTNHNDYKIYNLTGGTQNLMSTTETNYFDAGSSTSTTTYFYNYNKHYQLDRTEVTDSKGSTIKTKNYNPLDVVSTTSLGHDALTTTEKAAIDQLKLQNRIATPVQVETYEDNALLSTQRTNYKNSNGLYLPEIIQTAKGTSALEDRIVFHTYDTKGNPVEVSKKDGTKIYYVWGYNQTQPIAKIEGYTTISSAQQTNITNAIAASNNDNSAANETALRNSLTTLRTSFTGNIQITTFTYDPLVGVTSVTDPRGRTVYYEYDSFNRLKLVKDDQNNIVKENIYHYKNQ